MKRLKSLILTSILGGLLVILPVALVFAIFSWIFRATAEFLSPLANLLSSATGISENLADILAIIALFGVCFFLGVFVRTRLGGIVYRFIENNIFYNFPFYKMIKEALGQFFGGSQAPFSRVALVQLFDSHIESTAFVTATHPDGSYTVFVPTAPNPTSGLIFHLPAHRVTLIDVPVERAMRTVLSCGMGSQWLLEKKKNLS